MKLRCVLDGRRGERREERGRRGRAVGTF